MHPPNTVTGSSTRHYLDGGDGNSILNILVGVLRLRKFKCRTICPAQKWIQKGGKERGREGERKRGREGEKNRGREEGEWERGRGKKEERKR